MMDTGYTNREIDRMFSEIQDSLGRIESLATRTNGRVGSLERWRAYTVGAVTTLILIVLPVLGFIAYQEITTAQQVSAMTSAK